MNGNKKFNGNSSSVAEFLQPKNSNKKKFAKFHCDIEGNCQEGKCLS